MILLALRFFTVLLPAVLLDLVLGDPRWLPHPVRWMGRTISALEPFLRRMFSKTPVGERIAGGALVLMMAVLFGGGSALLLKLCGMVSPWLAWGWRCGSPSSSCRLGTCRWRPWRCAPP